MTTTTLRSALETPTCTRLLSPITLTITTPTTFAERCTLVTLYLAAAADASHEVVAMAFGGGGVNDRYCTTASFVGELFDL